MTKKPEIKTNPTKNAKTDSQTATLKRPNTGFLKKKEWNLSAVKIAFYYRLFVITLLCVISAILALGEFPLELRIIGVATINGLAQQLLRNLTSRTIDS